jgi:hypothetical protein
VIQGLTDEELGLLAYWFALPPIERFLLTSSGLQRVFAVRLSSTELRNTAFVALKIKSGIPEAELLKFHPMLVETLAAKHDRFTIPSEIRDSEKEMAAGMAQRADAAAGATATMVTYPLDLLRARMAAHWGVETRYPSYRDALHAAPPPGHGSRQVAST